MAVERLILFLKTPRAGYVKTRLAQTIGPEKACAAYRELVEVVLGKVNGLDDVELRYAPDDAEDEVRPWLKKGWTAGGQGEGDLGDRLARAVDAAFADGARRVVIIGSDCVEFEAEDIKAAFRELAQFDVVIGPAVDGGYWLLGLRAPQPELFSGVAWSTDQVLAQTLQSAKQLGLRIQLLQILNDVDTEADWRAFQRSKRR